MVSSIDANVRQLGRKTDVDIVDCGGRLDERAWLERLSFAILLLWSPYGSPRTMGCGL